MISVLLITLTAPLSCTRPKDKQASRETQLRPPPAPSISFYHLDRIDQRSLPLDLKYSPPGDGRGVTIYILDTGVRVTHEAFSGRAAHAAVGRDGDLFGDESGRLHGGDDCHGHGTHMAGIAAGEPYGVAPGAAIRSIRISDCHGAVDRDVAVRAIDWVAVHAERPALALLSMGYGHAPRVRDAVERAVKGGILFVVAGGNIDQDACRASPANAPGAIVVAASTRQDKQTTFGSYGPCIDIFAPGEDVLSADSASDTATKRRSGSSPAAALVAGAAALYLQAHPRATPREVKEFLLDSATPDILTLTRIGRESHTPNRLLFVGEP